MEKSTIALVTRAEWVAVFIAAIFAYWLNGAGWVLFAILILAPDLAMTGYLAGPKVGGTMYNIAHFLLWPIALIAFGLAANHQLTLGIGLIWLAHIALDRMLGYGMKLPTGFRDTDMGRIGHGEA